MLPPSDSLPGTDESERRGGRTNNRLRPNRSYTTLRDVTSRDDTLRVLAIGSHADDLEIGCGGTLLALVEHYRSLEVRWIVLSASGCRAEEARASAESLFEGGRVSIELGEFRDGFFPYEIGAIKEFFEGLKWGPDPDLIFTHHGEDRHQDHRTVSDLTWNTFRDHLILEYEIPKYDGDFGRPNLFVELSDETCRRKIDHLLEHFGSQADRHWFTEDLFLAALRLRGMEAHSETRYAEAFYARKLVCNASRLSSSAYAPIASLTTPV